MKLKSFLAARKFFFKKYNLGKCELVRELGEVSKERWTVPDHIVKPPYYETLNRPSKTDGNNIEIKSDEDITRMRRSCKLAANILKKCADVVQVKKKLTVNT